MCGLYPGCQIRKNRPILDTPGNPESPQPCASRVKFYRPLSDSSMKETGSPFKRITAGPLTAKLSQAQATRSTSPTKKRTRKSVAKSVTFLEPEVENTSETSSRKEKRNRSRSRKPLLPFNSSLNQESKIQPVSMFPIFKPNSKTNRGACHVSNLKPDITVLTDTKTQLTKTNLTDSNGSDSTTDAYAFKSGSQTSTTNAKTMGISFICGYDNSSRNLISKQLSSHQEISRGVNSDNCAININLKQFNSSSLTNSSLTKTNINIINNNKLSNDSSYGNVNSPEKIKSADVIREENRLRRNLFFGTVDTESESLFSPVSNSGENINMNGANKISNFGFRGLNDKKANSSSTHIPSRTDTFSPQQKSSNVTRSNEISIPKLYSVHNNQDPHCGQSLKSSKSLTHVPPVVYSKLPTFNSGSSIKFNPTGNNCNVRPSNQGQRSLYPRIPSHPLRAPKFLDHKKEEPKVNQWVTGSEFFKPKQAPPTQQLHAEPRRETLPSRFGYGYSNGLSTASPPSRRSLLESQDSNNDRRASVYPSGNSKLPLYNFGVKKPVESEPFYMMGLYKNRNTQSTKPATSLENRSILPYSATTGFTGVSTGVVKERALQYQTKITEAVSSSNSGLGSPLKRSSTYVVKSSVPADDKIRSSHIIQKPWDTELLGVNDGYSSQSTTIRKSFGQPGIPLQFRFLDSSGDKEILEVEFSHNYENNRNAANVRDKNPSTSLDGISLGYPLSRDGSTSSSVTSSEDPSSLNNSCTAGDADKAISDSEFLIDDEISDQPDLTLTFKDSSLILSPSSSGESLISCDLMLDYQESSCSGLVSSDSTLLVDEVSLNSHNKTGSIKTTEILTTSSGVSQKNMVHTSANGCRRNPGVALGRNVSPGSTTSPLGSSNKSTKTSFICHRSSQNHQTQNGGRSITIQQNTNSIQRLSKYSGAANSSPVHDVACVTSPKSNVLEHNLSSPSNARSRAYTSKSPHRNSIGTPRHSSLRTPSPVVSSKCTKTKIPEAITQVNDVHTSSEQKSDVAVDNFIKDISFDVSEYKNQLKELLSVLEINEGEILEKDEVILKQQKEIGFLKNKILELERKCFGGVDKCDGILICGDNGDNWHKEKGIVLTKETVHAAVQTENNNQCRAAVTYPDENDKVGQLVSFRIGRSSSNSNKS